MHRYRLCLLGLALAFLVPTSGQSVPKPINPNLLCKYKCTNAACVSDIFTPSDSYCSITWNPVGCEGGRDPEACRSFAGG